MKNEGYLGLTCTWGQKPLKIWWRKWQKILDWIGRGEKVRKSLKKLFEIVKNTWEEAFYKTQLSNFDHSKIRFEFPNEKIITNFSNTKQELTN